MMSRDERDIDFEAVTNEAIDFLNKEDMDGFRAIFLELHNYEQSEIYQTLSDQEKTLYINFKPRRNCRLLII